MGRNVAPAGLGLAMSNHHDRDVLRQLAGEWRAAAELPVCHERRELWRRLNDLDSVRPMLWITEVPWHELPADGELTLHCEDGWARGVEAHLRRTLYEFRHFEADRVIEPWFPCGMAIRDTGLGYAPEFDLVRTDPASDIISRRYHAQIREPADLERIHAPEVSYDEAATARHEERLNEAFGDLLEIRRTGVRHIWYTPWDHLIQWWGVEQAMFDLVDRPEMVHDAVERIVVAMLAYLDQLEAQKLLTHAADNSRVGSGGYGYVSDLPDPPAPRPATAPEMWGCSNAQIFSEVSPEMHWEFAVRHDLPWAERWGLNYYGCCEQLHHKVEILRRIPRLRKISMNYRINAERAAETVGGEFVFSYKPNPAFLAEKRFRLEAMRRELETVLELTRGCHVEIILKDISTCAGETERVTAWNTMARELVEQYASA